MRLRRRETKTKVRTPAAVCAACGELTSRELANYCFVCGKILEEDYQPLDSLRASYRLQGRAYLVENGPTEEITDLFEVNRNSASETAWASCVYSMVPYVGVIFIPFTLIAGFIGFGISVRYPRAGGAKLSSASFGLSFPILGLQLLLWWLLYLIPELSRGI